MCAHGCGSHTRTHQNGSLGKKPWAKAHEKHIQQGRHAAHIQASLFPACFEMSSAERMTQMELFKLANELFKNLLCVAIQLCWKTSCTEQPTYFEWVYRWSNLHVSGLSMVACTSCDKCWVCEWWVVYINTYMSKVHANASRVNPHLLCSWALSHCLFAWTLNLDHVLKLLRLIMVHSELLLLMSSK